MHRLGDSSDDCPTDMQTIDYALGWFLVIGTWISFLPQHVKIYRQKTHVGLSFQGFSLAQLVSVSTVGNYILLSYRSTFECCNGTTFYGCSASYLAFLQLVVAMICQHMIIFLYLYFFDHTYAKKFDSAQGRPPGTEWKRTVKLFTLLMLSELVLLLLVPAFMIPFGLDSDVVSGYGLALNIMSGVTIAYHWTPQIWKTYKLRKLGSLSFIMLLLQSTGSLLAAYNLSSHGNILLWFPYLIVSLMQGCLIVLIGYLYCVDGPKIRELQSQTYTIQEDDNDRHLVTAVRITTTADGEEEVTYHTLSEGEKVGEREGGIREGERREGEERKEGEE